MEWNKHLEVHLRELDEKKPVIWTGDLNVAPTEKGLLNNRVIKPWLIPPPDLTNAKRNWNKAAGYTEAETSWYRNLLEPPAPEGEDARKANKFIDVWRHRNPELRHYTYFSFRFGCRGKGIGWRLDHCTLDDLFYILSNPSPTLVVVSERLLDKVKTCEIRSEIYGASDHCPIVLEVDDTDGGTDGGTEGVKDSDTVSTTDTQEAAGPSAV